MGTEPVVDGEAEFSVRREDWSKYELLDGRARVWVRVIVTKILEAKGPPGPTGEPHYGVSAQTVVTAFFDKSLKRSPDNRKYPKEELRSGGTTPEFHTIEEPWNEYIIAGKKPKLLKVKVVAVSIQLHLDKINSMGDPIVNVDSQIVLSPATDAIDHVPR